MIIKFPLIGKPGLEIRQRAFDFLGRYATTTGAERGSLNEQGAGLLAEIVVRELLGYPRIEDDEDRNTNLGRDLLLPSGVKVDVKCRGGKMPFSSFYPGTGGIDREAKHNFFARQVFDDKLDTDIYLMTHLMTPDPGTLPGTLRQKKWCLYICGWVSKARVKREGVYLERGSLTEQGNTWFTYRGQEIEFYQKNLNEFSDINDLLSISLTDVEDDISKVGEFNLTGVDAVRIALDLYARGFLKKEQVDFVKLQAKLSDEVEPILNPNQYLHLAEWLYEKNKISEAELNAIKTRFPKIEFSGI